MDRRIMCLLILLISFSSCMDISLGGIRGNGRITREKRDMDDFNAVEVHGALVLNLRQGPEYSVVIEGDENLLRHVSVETEGNTLVVRQGSGISMRPTRKIQVHVTAPNFSRLAASGACSIFSSGPIVSDDPLAVKISGAGELGIAVEAPEVSAALSGSGELKLSGKVETFVLDLSGAADADCSELESDDTRVEISGAGKADVVAHRVLKGDISGAGRLRYRGDADRVAVETSGAGKVEKMDE
jgi:hypothetical protein